MLEELTDSGGRVVGSKQVIKSAKSGHLEKMFIAEDTDGAIKEELISIAEQNKVEYVFVPTKKELGQACNIQVMTACAGILK